MYGLSGFIRAEATEWGTYISQQIYQDVARMQRHVYRRNEIGLCEQALQRKEIGEQGLGGCKSRRYPIMLLSQRSNSRMYLSDATMSVFPSRVTDMSFARMPLHTCTRLPSVLHMHTFLSTLPDTNFSPEGSHAHEVTSAVWTLKVAAQEPVFREVGIEFGVIQPCYLHIPQP